MADDFQEGIEELHQETLSPDLRGVVVDLDEARRKNQWIIAAVVAVVLSAFSGWAYWYMSKTDAQLLEERLNNHMEILAMLRQARVLISNSSASTEEIEHGISICIDVTHTPLRQGLSPQSPYIRERHLAMVESLEGLLRLVVEKRVDPFDPNSHYGKLLRALGEERLEYFENGVLERVPLLESSWVLYKIREERRNRSYVDDREIAELERQLSELELQEEIAVTTAAYTLGRWFRFYNDMENAERCFQIGRRYVEGYEVQGEYQTGHRPKALNHLWKAYVGTLESLAETRFQAKQFREARSYLSRMFQTPVQSNPFQKRYELSRASPYRTHRIRALTNDIGVIREAIASPYLIPSFPQFTVGEKQINLNDLRRELRQISETADNSALGLLWVSLSDSSQHIVKENIVTDEANAEFERDLVDVLNLFIADPGFHRQVTFSAETLSDRGKEIWEKTEREQLQDTEYAFLHREIIDQTLTAAVAHPYILSDGSRISNELSSEQRDHYQQLAETLIKHPQSPPELKQSYSQRLASIRQGSTKLKLSDFQELLHQHQELQNRIVSYSKQSIEAQKGALKQLQHRIQELESTKSLDLARLGRIEQKEARARTLLKDAEAAKDQANARIEELEEAKTWVVQSLHQQLTALEEELKYLETHEDPIPRSAEANQEILLSQLEEQIALRQKYLELLKGLRATGGEREIERIRIEKSRLEGLISVLSDSIAKERGDKRELLQAELAEHEAARHALLEEFNNLYSPLRETVNEIAAKEEEIWQAELQLRETQEEILELVGNAHRPGLIEEQSRRLGELLLQKSQDTLHSPLYDSEIRRLNQDVSEAHARLNILLQKESQYRVMLEAFYPHFFRNELLFKQGGKLAPLQHYLHQQERLMAHYRNLWQMGELREDIRLQHTIVLENLQRIDTELAEERKFSREKTENLTRYMQALLEARKQLNRNNYLLKELAKGEVIHGSLREITGRGYLIDSVEMFQLEHQMGLNISEYRRSFDERNAILEQLRLLLDEQHSLEQEKIRAARTRDQEKIDQLIPQVAEKDALIDILTRKELAINQRLRQLANDYRSRLHQVRAFQEKIRPQMVRIDQRLCDLNQEIIVNERELEDLIGEIFTTADHLKKSITALNVDDLNNVDEIIQLQENELLRLAKLRDLKKHENYYKSKALYWMGRTFYEESKLPDFQTLVRANAVPESMIRDHQRHAKLQFEEFDPVLLSKEHEIIKRVPDDDEDMISYQYWIDSLEKNALRIFQHDLPQHIPPEVFAEDRQLANADDWLRDSQIYVARSRFQMGQIYLKRGLRYIRSTVTPTRKNDRAKKELDQAITTFMGFLDFTRPFAHNPALGLSETRLGSQEFPIRQRYPVHLDDEAHTYLGICSSLKGDHHQAISHYRNLLKTMIAREGESRQLSELTGPAIGQVDPVLTESLSFSPHMSPIYASLLAQTPQAHEVLYRMGRAYHHLANEQYRLGVEHSYLPPNNTKDFQKRFENYSLRALAYYSQLTLTHSYSPYQKAARLQSARLYKLNGHYLSARDHLTAILGDPKDLGGSMEASDLTEKGDLPGELNPGYSLVAFELGKLHLENKNYAAAAQAFMLAKEGDPENIVVLKAKIAYAETLIESKEWLMADLLLNELIEEQKIARQSLAHLYPPEIWIQLSKVKESMGNLSAAKEALEQLYAKGPLVMRAEKGGLDLNDRYTMIMLEQEHRDAIRPLAEATFHYARLSLRQRHWQEAEKYFKDAETLFHKVPWQQDPKMRRLKQSDYLAYKRQQLLKCRWGQQRTHAQELIHSAMGDYRKEFNQLAYMSGPSLQPSELIGHISETLKNVADHRQEFVELAAALDEFHTKELKKLPEVIEAARILQQREIDSQLGRPQAIRYEALSRMREKLVYSQNPQLPLNADTISLIFAKNSLEYQILNEFALAFSNEIQLTDDDRNRMLSGYSNIDNLKSIPNALVRLDGFADAFMDWMELEMQSTGLDDMFIPVSAESAVLEEVDLYRVSARSHIDGSESYDHISSLADDYLQRAEAVPNRVSNPETLWQIIEIAAMSAEQALDWDRVATYNRFLLQPEQKKFFVQKDKGDLYRAELSLAQALIEISHKIYSDLIFMQDENEQILAQQQAEEQIREARQRLKGLINVNHNGGSAISTRIRAKELLSQMGA